MMMRLAKALALPLLLVAVATAIPEEFVESSEELPDYLQDMQGDIKADDNKVSMQQTLVDVDAKVSTGLKAQARAQARAKAEYDESMAKMQALSDKLGRMEKDYNKRADEADQEAFEAGQRDRTKVAAALLGAAASPMVGLETGHSEEQQVVHRSPMVLAEEKRLGIAPKKEESFASVLADATKHPEADQLLEEATKEHAKLLKSKDPMALVKHMAAKRKAEKTADVKRILQWNALRDGWDASDEDMQPDEGEVHVEALNIESKLEKDGTTLSNLQKEQIEEATRAHMEGEKRIAMAQKRLGVMNKLVEEDRMDARKKRASAEVEQLMDEQDQTNLEVQMAEQQAKQALDDQDRANAPEATDNLVNALQDYREAMAEEEP